MNLQSSDAATAADARRRTSGAGDHEKPLERAGTRLLLNMPARVSWVPACRHLLIRWLDNEGHDRKVTDVVALVTTELITNAVEHCPDADAFEVEATVEPEAIRMRVSNRSAVEVPWTPSVLPHPTAISGRGLFLVDALADQLDIRRQDDLTTIDVRIPTSRQQTSPNDQTAANDQRLPTS
jgi:anti-sigma regulatory factor (Ser/Thr protein kinase)